MAAVITVLAAGLAVVGSFWRRSVLETRRAEAAFLISHGQMELDTYPTAALAYATASLEQADSPVARRLALEALWKGPTAFVADQGRAIIVSLHDLGIIPSHFTRTIFLDSEIIADGPAGEVLTAETLSRAYGISLCID